MPSSHPAPERLSPEREAEIAARAEAAYPGPWRRSEEGLERTVLSEDDVVGISFGYRGNNTQAEADFVAHAREDVPALLAELAAVRAERDELAEQRDQRRARLVALQNDALNMRGALSPNGQARKVPFPLGESLTPAVEWLISRVAELEALTAQATQFRIDAPDGSAALLIRRSTRGKWAVIESEARGRRKALTPTGWRIAAVLADSDIFVWPDAATAVAQARTAIASGTEAAR